MTQTQFDQAVALHSRGQVDEAMALYQNIIEQDSTHADAIHLLGVALSQKGQFLLAAQFIQNAIGINPNISQFHINQGNALSGAGEHGAALQAYSQAIALNDEIPEAWFGMGNALSALNQPEHAVQAYQKAIQLRPDFAEALVNMGGLLVTLKRLDPAVEALSLAATLRPNDAQPRYLMAQALEAAGYPSEAATLYSSLVDVPNCAVSLLFEGGKRLAALGLHALAVNAYKTALLRVPGEVVLWNNLGNSLRDLDQLDDAKSAYTQALALAPDDAGILSNLGTVLKDLGNLSEAIGLLRRAVALGGDASAHSNLGHALYLQGNLDAASASFQQALDISPDDPDARFHLGVVQLQTGQWAQGWKNYESRWNLRRTHEPMRHQDIPLWDGGDLTGKTILIWSEQGLGDTLHFIRLVDQVAAKGSKVVVECQPALVELLRTMPQLDTVIAVGQSLPKVDVQVPLLGLPAKLGLTLENLPAMAPYLSAPDGRKEAWKRWNVTTAPRVGLVWSGESRRQDVECLLIDRRRSMALQTLAPLLALDGIQFVSLQLGPAQAQLSQFDHVLDPAERIQDFADTAALIDTLDLVVSVDTSVAHLAGAMGKPIWLLSRFDGCWRWLQDRKDSPWYPNMTIYSQRVAGDWSEPVAQLAQDMVRWRERQ